MRVIGQLQNEEQARRFGDFLYVRGLANNVEADQGGWVIWVHDDDHLAEATEWLAKFRSNPAAQEFSLAADADTLRSRERKDLLNFQKRMHSRAEVRQKFSFYGVGKLTVSLMAISIAVFLVSSMGENEGRIMPLFITNWNVQGHFLSFEKTLPEIRHGEVWRLFTPMFIHFGIIHILFNLLWLRDLGSMIERRESAWRLLFLVLVIAAGSNLAQFLIHIPSLPTLSGGSPVFGGMSGVVYGLFGYIWMRGKFDPRSSLVLHKSTVTMMLIWLVVCMTGWLGPIANLAHFFGLLIGMAAGFAFSQLEIKR
ncbi:MAG: rhomboid family intramembrane serine protease [Verrucomicrobiota bacterium]